MKNITVFYLFITLLICSNLLSAQDTTFIYGAENWKPYFDDPILHRQFYDDYKNLKDSLPDGFYIFDNRDTKELSRKIYCYRTISGRYINNRKSGRFEFIDYSYRKKLKKYIISNYSSTEYKNGVLHGKSISYYHNQTETGHIYTPMEYCEYENGVRNGKEIEFISGKPIQINYYENGKLINSENLMPYKSN